MLRWIVALFLVLSIRGGLVSTGDAPAWASSETVLGVSTQGKAPTTYAVYTVAVLTSTSVQIAPANPARKGFATWNNSANSAYVGPCPVTSAVPFTIVATFTSWQVWQGAYTGALCAIRNSGTGNMTTYDFN